jgi:hypothetical protein
MVTGSRHNPGTSSFPGPDITDVAIAFFIEDYPTPREIATLSQTIYSGDAAAAKCP